MEKIKGIEGKDLVILNLPREFGVNVDHHGLSFVGKTTELSNDFKKFRNDELVFLVFEYRCGTFRVPVTGKYAYDTMKALTNARYSVMAWVNRDYPKGNLIGGSTDGMLIDDVKNFPSEHHNGETIWYKKGVERIFTEFGRDYRALKSARMHKVALLPELVDNYLLTRVSVSELA